jgi:putative membrane protein insertion efficiency factor
MSRAAEVAIWAVRSYQVFLRPLLPPACRFAPTCSEYCVEALSNHGLWRGLWLAIRRIGRCHPWNPGGYDPPPMSPHRERSGV